MNWFTKLTGIDEESPAQVREQLSEDGDCIVCPGGKRIAFGRLETPKLSELRRTVANLQTESRPSTLREVVGDVRSLHADPVNAGALVQVASQFNLLEMTGPSVTPERGVGIDENDPIQGPACAIACGAGHRVSQAYCSALPVAYGRQPTERWSDFAQLILDAAYEATLATTVINSVRTGSRVIYLTLLGGGAFGNRDEWIVGAIERAYRKHAQRGLDVRIVSYSRSKPLVAEVVSHLSRI